MTKSSGFITISYSIVRTTVQIIKSFAALLIIAGILSACTPATMSGSLSHRLTAWNSGSLLKQTVNTLTVDDQHIRTLQAGHNPAAVRTACEAMGVDARRANSYLPTPDQQITNILNTAYTAEYTASIECYKDASQPASSRLLAGYDRLVAQADSQFAQATKLYNEIVHNHDH